MNIYVDTPRLNAPCPFSCVLVYAVHDDYLIPNTLTSLGSRDLAMDDFSAYNELSPEKRELLELLIAESASQFNCFPLSFAQQRLWFVEQLNPNTSAYNIFAAVKLSGSLNVTALHESLNEIVRRHEALRTSFATVKEEPMQVINPISYVDLLKIDLQYLPKLEQQTELQRLAIAEAEKPFDLSKAPLIRITLLQLSETEHVLLLVMHHIISDGWSIGVLLTQVAGYRNSFASLS